MTPQDGDYRYWMKQMRISVAVLQKLLSTVRQRYCLLLLQNFITFFACANIEDNQLLTEHQSRFRPHDSCVNQLALLYHQFAKALDHKKDIKLVFCDVTIAFDRVWHDGLIY